MNKIATLFTRNTELFALDRGLVSPIDNAISNKLAIFQWNRVWSSLFSPVGIPIKRSVYIPILSEIHHTIKSYDQN